MSNSNINKEMVLALPAQKTVEEVKKYVCYHCPIFSETKGQDLKAKDALPLGARFKMLLMTMIIWQCLMVTTIQVIV